MAIGHADSPKRRFGGVLDALFGEAFELEQRRRRRLIQLALLCCAAAVAVALLVKPGSNNAVTRTASATGHVSVTSTAVPAAADYTGLSVAGGKLLLIDYGNGAVGAGGGGVCQTATVDPQSLKPTSVTRGACDDPALFHQNVIAVDQWATKTSVISVRIATVNPHVKAGYTLGPVVFAYNQCSDCYDEPIYGDGALWIYAPFSTSHFSRASGELYRISERTGRVTQRWPMPAMPQVLLAVDRDGLWLAPSIESGGPSDLYRVAPGMPTPQRALALGTVKNPGIGARYLVADGHTVWLETWMATPGSIARLWRLNGTKVTISGKRVKGSAATCTDIGDGPATVHGNASMGIYCVQIGNWQDGAGATTQSVFRISPGLLEEQRVATVKPPPGTDDVQAAVTLDNSYYFLDPATETLPDTDVPQNPSSPTRNVNHAGRLFRVSPS